MKIIQALLIIKFFFFINLYGQQNIIAKFDGGKIDEDDFLFRYEMTPYPRKHLDEFQNELKMEFALSVIAEKLFAFEAKKNKSVLNSDVMKCLFPRMRSIILRDALYREKIYKPTRASEKEIMTNYIKGLTTYKAIILIFNQENLARKFYARFQKNEPLENILYDAARLNIDTSERKIEFGDLSPELESELYKLKNGEVSQLIRFENKWHIIIVKDISINANPSESEKERIYGKVKSVIEGRKEEKTREAFWKEFFKGKKASSDGKIFSKFSNWFSKKLSSIKTDNDSSLILFTYEFIREAQSELGEEVMNAPFIFLENKSYSLKEFLYDLAYIQNFRIPKYAIPNLTAILNSKIKYFIENEYLALEAEKKKLDSKKEVKKDIDLWQDYYLAEVYKLSLKDEISFNEVDLASYERIDTIQRKFYRIHEIFVYDISDAEFILSELNKGADFKALYEKYNKREITRSSNGELAFYDNLFPELAQAADKLMPGEIFGPIANEGGYSIIKLIEKNIFKVERESERDKRLRIWNEKYFQALEKRAAALAKKYNLTINEKTIKNIQTTKTSVIAYRFYGFGGRTIAVPFISPFWNWYYLLEDRKID